MRKLAHLLIGEFHRGCLRGPCPFNQSLPYHEGDDITSVTLSLVKRNIDCSSAAL
jgi:hypothetical protein